ncbi:MAG: DNA mismatch repair protein MutS [Eubacteriaceae bacterium]|nr:DNA mismatch repair protein MutS [Eubacteriaceae bacterium]
MEQLTPMMKQYLEIHEKVKDAILFFRLGDFYEMFFDDAITASRELEITLTGRDCGLEEKAPMCGVPYHAAEGYIARLIEKGYKVAICEQVENPRDAKGIVKRDIVQIISPGTVSDGKILKDRTNNYLMSIFYNMVDYGIAYLDVSTGEFYITQISGYENRSRIFDEIAKVNPSELLINTVLYKDKAVHDSIRRRSDAYINVLSNKYFELESSKEIIREKLHVYSLASLGIEDREFAVRAAGSLLRYLEETQKRSLVHIDRISHYEADKFMALDQATRNNLELVRTIRSNDKKGSLLGVLDKTETSMGGRKLRQWINEPLTDPAEINRRLDAVENIFSDVSVRERLKNILGRIYDLKRITGKLSFGSCNARDMIALKDSIKLIPDLKEILEESESSYLSELQRSTDSLTDIYELIERSIDPDGPISVKEGNLIRLGFNEEVDYYRNISVNSKELILKMEAAEKDRTGIKSLKIKYNKVFGYYIEITNTNLPNIPDNYIRKQTLSNCERFFTPELKELENKITGANEKLIEMEYDLFQEVRQEILKNVERIKGAAEQISVIDVLYSFAAVSYENSYVKPSVDDSDEIIIIDGRHPVVETMTGDSEFVPNSCELDRSDNRMIIITGPNMAGKSTYIRQIALITLMAQTGCFVPAAKARIGVCDRIFTRVGASDDLASGQSTFMVEMSEVSNILKNATSKSLVILDEIGRGTSTFDGLSIAWSVAEFLADQESMGCRTLFATHYHELTELEEVINGVRNYCIKVQEREEGVIFLRKIAAGSADKSYGIEVAKLAGLPGGVIKRAKELLLVLEEKENRIRKVKKDKTADIQTEDRVNLFNYQDKLIMEEINNLPLEEMTPMEAMNYLNDLKKRLK